MDTLAWFLVLSHIFFLPAVAIAIWKRAWGLTLVLIGLVVASSWYHACRDGGLCDDTYWGRADMVMVAAAMFGGFVYAFYRHTAGQIITVAATSVALLVGLLALDISIWWFYGVFGIAAIVIIIHALSHKDRLDIDWTLFWWAIGLAAAWIILYVVEHAIGERWLHVVQHVVIAVSVTLLILARKKPVPPTQGLLSEIVYFEEELV